MLPKLLLQIVKGSSSSSSIGNGPGFRMLTGMSVIASCFNSIGSLSLSVKSAAASWHRLDASTRSDSTSFASVPARKVGGGWTGPWLNCLWSLQ